MRLQIDTASDITIISKENWLKLGCPEVIATEHLARNACGEALPLSSKLQCQISFNGTTINTSCYISDIPQLNILGIDWIDALKLFDELINTICSSVNVVQSNGITSNQIQNYVTRLKEQYSEIFDGSLGLCTKAEAVLHLKPGSVPVFKPKRPVPYATYPSIDDELNRLEVIGVIEKVDYSQWAAPIVAVKKATGAVRICGDFSTGLNSALESHQYPLPLPEDIFATLAGGKYFSKIDLSDAYL